MLKPRYDKQKNISRHAAVDPDCCEDMETKYRWKLIDIEPLDSDIFKVDCVFEGKTEFPKSYYDQKEENNNNA